MLDRGASFLDRQRAPSLHHDRHRLHREIVEAVNGLIGAVVETPTPETANQEFAVRHGLGRVPTEVSTLMRDAAGHVYRSSASKWSVARPSPRISIVPALM